MSKSNAIPFEDRLPTFAEIEGFDPRAAWGRLTPAQQREIGMLAVRFGTVGQCMTYVWNEIESNPPKGWTPYQVEAGNWPKDHIDRGAALSDQSFQDLCDQFDPLWPTLFGWDRSQPHVEIQPVARLSGKSTTGTGGNDISPGLAK